MKIAISIFDGDTERVLLRTGILSTLLSEGHNVALLVRGKERFASIEKLYADKHLTTYPLPNAESKLEAFWYYLSWNTIPTRAVYVRQQREFGNAGRYGVFLIARLVWILGHSRVWREFLRLCYAYTPDTYADVLFDDIKPDLLFAGNMFSPEDARLLRNAKRRGITTVTIAKSWDVLTTKAFTRVKADRILVYNTINKREACVYGDYQEERVAVIGFPQFDVYASRTWLESREEFCLRAGLNPKKSYFLYGLPGDWKSPDTRAILKKLDEHIEKGTFSKEIQILARFHPKYTDSSSGLDAKHVVFDVPGSIYKAQKEFSIDAGAKLSNQWVFSDSDIRHLANSLYHAEGVLCVDSTLVLDAAALGKHTILIGFDGDRTLPYKKSIRFIYERDHYQHVLTTKAASLVTSYEELVVEIERLLMGDKTYKNEELAVLRKTMLYALDGASVTRAVNAILTTSRKNSS